MDDLGKRAKEIWQKAHRTPPPSNWELILLRIELKMLTSAKKRELSQLKWVVFQMKVDNFILELVDALLAWYLGENSGKRWLPSRRQGMQDHVETKPYKRVAIRKHRRAIRERRKVIKKQ